ncbi:MAG: alkaline shock response membrane anchor protein AmaP [Clostridia bacterium]|nr:alkaline shock response membrane anchor protein AmaP [Clostridia bacterium]
MKKFLRTMIIIFSLIVVAVSAVSLCLITDLIDITSVAKVVGFLGANEVRVIISFVVFILLGVLGLVCIVASDTLTSDIKGGVELSLDVGNVHISNQTFENIVLNVAKKYGSLKTNRVAVKMTENGILVDVYAYVLQDTVISDITEKLQKDIKETVLKQTTVEVNNVNVKVKGIYELNEPKN